MKTEQAQWSQEEGWVPHPPGSLSETAQLVLVFGAPEVLANADQGRRMIVDCYKNAQVVGCSTAGEILGTKVSDGTLCVTAIEFASARVKTVSMTLDEGSDSRACGHDLATSLIKDDLTHIFLLSDGLNVNGSELIAGMHAAVPESVAVTGGLAGDGDRFEKTLVVHGTACHDRLVVAVGFYGQGLSVGYGSLGGWDPFGPERLITRSDGNVLYELDGQSALALYKKYLGDYADGLPGTGLLFPLSIRPREGGDALVRTVLAVDADAGSMTFAGDMPEGSLSRLMKANFDRLIDGAQGAATDSFERVGSETPDLAILISCVGRKMVLKQRVEEEVEGVRDVLGDTAMIGFYSYGEISPVTKPGKCELHNQTMTITTFAER